MSILEFNRKLPNGQPVRKYGELIEYLLAKDKGIKALEMDFEGKNVLLYHLGNSTINSTCGIQNYELLQQLPLRDPGLKKDLMCRGEAVPAVWWKLSSSSAAGRSCQCGTTSEQEESNMNTDACGDSSSKVS